MDDLKTWLPLLGAGCFGAMVGWIAHFAFRPKKDMTVPWLGAMRGVIGGGAVTALLKAPLLFGAYGIGLGIAFVFRVFTAPIGMALGEDMAQERRREEPRRARRQRQRHEPPTSPRHNYLYLGAE